MFGTEYLERKRVRTNGVLGKEGYKEEERCPHGHANPISRPYTATYPKFMYNVYFEFNIASFGKWSKSICGNNASVFLYIKHWWVL
jgi:hypothetical protein